MSQKILLNGWTKVRIEPLQDNYYPARKICGNPHFGSQVKILSGNSSYFNSQKPLFFRKCTENRAIVNTLHTSVHHENPGQAPGFLWPIWFIPL